jgi:hypothetical protein
MDDFSGDFKLSCMVYGLFFDDGTYTSELYIWIYKSSSLIKYTIEAAKGADRVLVSVTMNK